MRREKPIKRRNPSGEIVWMARYTGRHGKRRIAKPTWNRGKGTFRRKADAQKAIDEAYGLSDRPDTLGDYAATWTERHPRSERTNATNDHRIGRVAEVEIEGIPLKDWPLRELRRRHTLALAVEFPDYVLVDVPEHLCVPPRYRGAYEVIQPDSTFLTYRPGEEQYFEQVLLDLSRMFAIGERGAIEGDDAGDVLDLLRSKVLEPLRSMTVGHYSDARRRQPVYQVAAASLQESIEDQGSVADRMFVAV